MGLSAYYNIPFGGSSPQFDIHRAMLQGATEAGLCCNASVAAVIAPLDQMWHRQGFGFKLLESSKVWTHIIWSDNIWLIAENAAQLKQMLLDHWGWAWKHSTVPNSSSLRVLFGVSLQGKGDNITILVDDATDFTWANADH